MSPGNSSNKLLDNWLIGPRLRESAHVKQVSLGESFHLRKLCAQVTRQTINYLGSPPLTGLPVQDFLADAPIKSDEFLIYGDSGANLGCPNLAL